MIRAILLCVTLMVFCNCSNSGKNRITSTPSFLKEKDVQLSPPIIDAPVTLFSDSTSITLETTVPGSQIRYSINDAAAQVLSIETNSQLTIRESGSYEFRSFHPSFQTSDVVKIDFHKLPDNLIQYAVEEGTKPSEKYSAEGWNSCMDGKRGTSNYGKDWLGFQEDKITIDLKLDRKKSVNGILTGFLSNQGAWIFLPKNIEVYNNANRISSYGLDDSDISNNPSQPLIDIRFDPVITNHLTLVIEPLQEIPEWHDGKGTTPWTFIDEIILL